MLKVVFGFLFIAVVSLVVALIKKKSGKAPVDFPYQSKKCYVLLLSDLFWVLWKKSLEMDTKYLPRSDWRILSRLTKVFLLQHGKVRLTELAGNISILLFAMQGIFPLLVQLREEWGQVYY